MNGQALCQQNNTEVWLDIQQQQDRVTMKLMFESSTDMKIRYRMEACKISSAGTSRSMQAGEKAVAAYYQTELCRLSMSMNNCDSCDVKIKIYQGEKLLFDEVKTIRPEAEK